MRVLLSWLNEYVTIPKNTTAKSIMHGLAKVGIEEADLKTFRHAGPIVVGKILSFKNKKQKNGYIIRLCKVKISSLKTVDIVCSAINFKENDLTVVALPGSLLFNKIKILSKKVYGYISEGVLLSSEELGFPKLEDGIIRLNKRGVNAKVGDNAIPLIDPYNKIVDVNITPDRGYCLSVRGIAREYSNLINENFQDPANSIFSKDINIKNKTNVHINDTNPIRGKVGCSQYIVANIDGVDPLTKTPAWMAYRLSMSGICPTFFLNDVSNYVMLELGQPINIYDSDRIHGNLIVKRASKDAKIRNKNNFDYCLSVEDLIISDSSKIISLAGIENSIDTCASSNSLNIIIESASFDKVTIYRSSLRHKIQNESSKRFERGTDTYITKKAIRRAIELIIKFAGGKIVNFTSVGSPSKINEIYVKKEYINKHIGVQYTEKEIVSSLEKIGAQVNSLKLEYLIKPPTWRSDLNDEASISEEVVRWMGYDNIPSNIPAINIKGRGLTQEQKLHRRVVNTLAILGLHEVKPYPFICEKQKKDFGHFAVNLKDGLSSIKIKNPLNNEISFMPPSLLPGLIHIARKNLIRDQKDLAIFSDSIIFIPKKAVINYNLPDVLKKPSRSQISKINSTLPDQPRCIAGLLGWNNFDQNKAWMQKKCKKNVLEIINILSNILNISINISQGYHPSFHPKRIAVLKNENIILGYAGELHPKIVQENKLQENTAVFEINLTELLKANKKNINSFIVPTKISPYPAVVQDISLLVDASIPVQAIIDTIRIEVGNILEDINLFDEYRGKNFEKGKKSLSFTMKFRSMDRTLTVDEVSKVRENVVKIVEKNFHAIQR